MEGFHGIGNFDGKKRTGGHAHSEVPRHEEPCDKYGKPTIREDGPLAQIACRLLCLDGDWPGWFKWAVGDPVPRRFQQEAARLAMLMGTGREWPLVFQRTAVARQAAEPTRGRWTSSLPAHVCTDGKRTLDGLGVVASDNSITCSARRTFEIVGSGKDRIFRPVDSTGCGKRFILNKWGLRVEENEYSDHVRD